MDQDITFVLRLFHIKVVSMTATKDQGKAIHHDVTSPPFYDPFSPQLWKPDITGLWSVTFLTGFHMDVVGSQLWSCDCKTLQPMCVSQLPSTQITVMWPGGGNNVTVVTWRMGWTPLYSALLNYTNSHSVENTCIRQHFQPSAKWPLECYKFT